MKVLQINCVYRVGSTGKIIYDLHTEMQKQGIESIVCYGRGKKIREPNVYKTCSEFFAKFNNLLTRFTGLMYGGCFFSTNKLLSILKREKPDIVHVHCINGYFVNIYRLITWLKKQNIETVLTLHAEFMYTANCGHAFDCEKWKFGCGKCPRMKVETGSFFFDRTHASWRKMKQAFSGFDKLTVVSVSPWLMDRAEQSPILADKNNCVVLNGIDTEIFKPQSFEKISKSLGLKSEKIIVHVSANFDPTTDNNKGGRYIVELANRLRIAGLDVIIIVAASKGKSENLPDNIIYVGEIGNQTELAQLYSMADITVITSRRETFGMPIAESLCCGTFVVGFQAGGPETIAISQRSCFVEQGNVQELFNIIKLRFSENDFSGADTYEARKVYSKALMCEKYIEIYIGCRRSMSH